MKASRFNEEQIEKLLSVCSNLKQAVSRYCST